MSSTSSFSDHVHLYLDYERFEKGRADCTLFPSLLISSCQQKLYIRGRRLYNLEIFFFESRIVLAQNRFIQFLHGGVIVWDHRKECETCPGYRDGSSWVITFAGDADLDYIISWLHPTYELESEAQMCRVSKIFELGIYHLLWSAASRLLISNEAFSAY